VAEEAVHGPVLFPVGERGIAGGKADPFHVADGIDARQHFAAHEDVDFADPSPSAALALSKALAPPPRMPIRFPARRVKSNLAGMHVKLAGSAAMKSGVCHSPPP
jgi:hypothetical protein